MDCLPEKQKEISESDAYALLSKKGYVILERSAYNELCEEAEKNHQGFAPDELQKSFEEGQKSIVGNPEKYGLQKEQKPAEWSEEDKVMLNMIEYRLKDWDNIKAQQGYQDDYTLPSPIKWLKSLRSSWKPSEEQMDALKSCFYESGECCPDEDGLRSLYEDLKKLM